MEQCPECGVRLLGAWVHGRREIIEVVPSPVQVMVQVYVAWQCPQCRRRWIPRVNLQMQVAGQARLGHGLVSLITALREEARLRMAIIQWYLQRVHQVHLSVGAIVAAG